MRTKALLLLACIAFWVVFWLVLDRCTNIYRHVDTLDIITYRHTKKTWQGVVRDTSHIVERDRIRVFYIYPDSHKLKVNPYESE